MDEIKTNGNPAKVLGLYTNDCKMLWQWKRELDLFHQLLTYWKESGTIVSNIHSTTQ